MSFAEQIEKPEVKKVPLVMIRPRRKVTAWTSMGGGVYRASFSYGWVNRCWIQYGVELTRAASASVAGGEFYHDFYNGYLYVGSVVDPTAVGRFVEYELHFSTQYFRGPRNPLDATSQVVDWQPYLISEPVPQNGSRDSLYGFNPLVASALNLANAGGALNVHLYDSSFRIGDVKVWLMVNEVMDKAIRRSEIKQTFLGYMGETLAVSEKVISINCTDMFGFLDKKMTFSTFSGIATADPKAIVSGQEWPIRRVRGRVQNFKGVNVDYAETPSLTDNRKWVLMEEEDLDEATYTFVVDHLAANTATKTFFTTTPKVMAGDTFAMTNDGVTRYGTVTAVDYAAKWITHDDFSGRSVVSGDTATRYYCGAITIIRESGQIVRPMPGRDFTRGYGSLATMPTGTMGIIFADDFEANVSMMTPFDPATDQIFFTVYGPKELPVYASSDPAGAATDYGGAAGQPESMLLQLLQDAGLDASLIDQASFEAAGDENEDPLGIALPRTASTTDYPSYKDVAQLILQSALWRLGFVESSNAIKIGIAPMKPFAAGPDYDVDELEHRGFNFEHDYASTYWTVRIPFNKKEVLPETESEDWTLGANDLARDLHFTTREFSSLESLHYVRDHAELLKDRLNYALGDRRGIYTFFLEQRFIDKTNLGASYELEREDLPGYEFVAGTKRSRQLAAIEVSKSSQGVNLVVEDQKGIQDNSGNWS